MSLDLSIPSKIFIRCRDLKSFPYAKLHPNSAIRHCFYKNVLELHGHAITKPSSNPSTGFVLLVSLSQEYIDELQENPQFLQALAKLM